VCWGSDTREAILEVHSGMWNLLVGELPTKGGCDDCDLLRLRCNFIITRKGKYCAQAQRDHVQSEE